MNNFYNHVILCNKDVAPLSDSSYLVLSLSGDLDIFINNNLIFENPMETILVDNNILVVITDDSIVNIYQGARLLTRLNCDKVYSQSRLKIFSYLFAESIYTGSEDTILLKSFSPDIAQTRIISTEVKYTRNMVTIKDVNYPIYSTDCTYVSFVRYLIVDGIVIPLYNRDFDSILSIGYIVEYDKATLRLIDIETHNIVEFKIDDMHMPYIFYCNRYYDMGDFYWIQLGNLPESNEYSGYFWSDLAAGTLLVYLPKNGSTPKLITGYYLPRCHVVVDYDNKTHEMTLYDELYQNKISHGNPISFENELGKASSALMLFDNLIVRTVDVDFHFDTILSAYEYYISKCSSIIVIKGKSGNTYYASSSSKTCINDIKSVYDAYYPINSSFGIARIYSEHFFVDKDGIPYQRLVETKYSSLVKLSNDFIPSENYLIRARLLIKHQ